MMRSGSSYLSASELALTFGLAQQDRVEKVEIVWSSGQVDHLTNVATGQTVVVTEGKGATANKPYGKNSH
jgi:hypothetical protein